MALRDLLVHDIVIDTNMDSLKRGLDEVVEYKAANLDSYTLLLVSEAICL